MIKKTFNIEIGRSSWLSVYLLSIHSLLLLMLFSLLSGYELIVAILLLVVSFSHYYRQYCSLKNHYILTLTSDNKPYWNIQDADNVVQKQQLLKRSVVTSRLVILYFEGASRWRDKSIIIVADAVDAERFRQLRVYLRMPKTFQP